MEFADNTGSDVQDYKYNGKELDKMHGLNWYDYSARQTVPDIGNRFTTIDPLAEKHFSVSPYVYCLNNPLKYVDPLGLDTAQRNTAIRKAEEYVTKNPGDSYEWNGKNGPGEGVDCSGLVSQCVTAGGEENPNKGNSNGVTNIANNTTAVEIKDAQKGNLIVLNKSKHIGIITEVIKDKDGNVIGFKFIDSGGKAGSGKSGPRVSTATIDVDYYGKRIDGIYKWDTKPDVKKKGSRVKSIVEAIFLPFIVTSKIVQANKERVNKIL